ncbi:MAG: tellurite resistance TerB family protein [Gammaproteobacteria bacterium]
MLRTIKQLFEQQIASLAPEDDPGAALPLAVAALLFEISRADHDVDDTERHQMAVAVASLCDTPEAEIEALLDSAGEAVHEAVSLYDFTSVVNEHFSHESKYELLLMLWRVAWADGRIDRYEDYYVRKIADLLHLSQREFIRAKHEAAGTA